MMEGAILQSSEANRKNEQEPEMRRILRRRDVQQLVGLGRSSIYSMMEKGTFPQSVKLGPRAVGWMEDEIEGWIEARVAERDRVGSR
jgi:prophage regulatory protein